MAAMNTKNLMLSPAATDLGLGTSLAQATQDASEEAKKRLKLMQEQRAQSPAGIQLLNPMTMGVTNAL